MVASGNGRTRVESDMDKLVRECLAELGHYPIDAVSETRTRDYLEKIINIIRGVGFGVAIFSQYTYGPTLANIFFEIGICNLLGKQVILVKDQESNTPSDLVRTEWISYRKGHEDELRESFWSAAGKIEDFALSFYEMLGDSAVEAAHPDYETAFERYRQAYLITGKKEVFDKLQQLPQLIREANDLDDAIEPTRQRLLESIDHFVRMAPNP